MPHPNAQRPAALTLDERARLDEELAVLIRAGVPLELGLRASAAELHGRLKRAVEEIAARLETGRAIPEALRESMPESEVAAVAAGLRSNRTPEVLDALARHSRAVAEVWRTLRYALSYPLALIVLAVTLLGTVGVMFVRGLHTNLAMIRGHSAGSGTKFLMALVSALDGYGWLVVVGSLVLLLAWTLLRPATARSRLLMSVIPGGRGILRDLDRATFAQLLAVLLEHGVPLPEAFRLAGRSVADSHLRRAAERTAGAVESGSDLARAVARESGFPPQLRRLFLMGALPALCAQGAETFRRRAGARAARLRAVLPAAATLCVGGGIVAAYSLSLIVPLIELFEALARPA